MYRPPVGEPRWLTRADFARLERELPEHLKAAAKFAVLTGLRMRAMLSLTWQQVDFAKKRAWVASHEMKAGRSLGIPLTPHGIQVLKTLPKNGDCVFQWRGERIDAVKRARHDHCQWPAATFWQNVDHGIGGFLVAREGLETHRSLYPSTSCDPGPSCYSLRVAAIAASIRQAACTSACARRYSSKIMTRRSRGGARE
jgi:hypothetical protein